MRRIVATGILALLFLPFSVCGRADSLVGTPEARPFLTATTILSGPHGNYEAVEPLAVWISDAKTFARHYRQLRSNVLGATEVDPPMIDFSQDGVLLVAMGRTATAGYQVTLASSAVAVAHGVAEVRVAWREPGPNEITAQVQTSPYLLLRLPRDGITRIRVVDQHRRIQAQTGTE